ncbi:hypothetical protein L6R53_19445 [Myxococcota bacterium]|nr:hypothetical protein [Myxococcota bacterium]
MTRTLLPALALICTGCGSGISGIWTMSVAWPTEDTCTDQVTHSFAGATPIASDEEEPTDEWTREESEAHTDQLMFVQVETMGSDQAVLIIGAEAWPGVKTAKGNYTFSWSGSDERLQDESHTTGYQFTYSQSAMSEEQLVLILDQGIGSGTWEVTSTAEEAWLESDLWSEEVRFQTGAIPADQYLVVTEGKGPKQVETPAVNTRDAVECEGALCSLTVTSACEGSLAVVLTQTDFDDDSAYQALVGSGQGYGAD